jgi:hypothetical protein
MNAGYLSAGAIIAMLGLWTVERNTEQAASADRRIVELLEITNQKQCVKDAKASGSPLGQRFIDGVALTDLGRMWDASEDVARLQSHWPAGLGGTAVRSAQNWIAGNSGSKLGVALAGYDVTLTLAPWDISAARAGENRCGRQTEVDGIRDKLELWVDPDERRIEMRVEATELIDDIGRDKLYDSERVVANKLLGGSRQ